MEISKYLRQHARTIAGKSQFFVNSFAKALEVQYSWSILFLIRFRIVFLFMHHTQSFSLSSKEYNKCVVLVLSCI
jgi:hypothetical protein